MRVTTTTRQIVSPSGARRSVLARALHDIATTTDLAAHIFGEAFISTPALNSAVLASVYRSRFDEPDRNVFEHAHAHVVAIVLQHGRNESATSCVACRSLSDDLENEHAKRCVHLLQCAMRACAALATLSFDWTACHERQALAWRLLGVC